MKTYLVGGAVRDEILGKKIHDRDFLVIGATEAAFLRAHPGARRIGADHPVYTYQGDEYTVSTLTDVRSDLMQRDLTINAFAKDRDKGQIISHPDAVDDLKNNVLRPVAEANFLRDPLRVFRAARFAAELPDFRVHPELIRIMGQVAGKGLLQHLSAERIGNETRKACSGESPGRFLRLLLSTGACDPWFVEFVNAETIPAGPLPHHELSLSGHTAEVMDRLAGSALPVWMGLCHDIGKADSPWESLPSHHGHDKKGEAKARDLGRRLRLPRRFIKAGALSAGVHMTAGRYDELRPGTRVRLLTQLHRAGLLADVFQVVQADRGKDFFDRADADLKRILKVKLPDNYHGLGKTSGEVLFQLQCRALA